MNRRREGGVLLVLGSGAQPYREYLLRAVASRYDVWLFNMAEPDWQASYVAGTTVLDVYDLPMVLRAARELGSGRRVLGVLSWDETLVVATAHVAEALGLPGSGLDGIEGCRDKLRSRRVLTGAGVPQPWYAMTFSAAEARAAAAEIGYPVVVKPRGMGASIGVVLAENPEQVDRAFAVADEASREGAVAYRTGALVEEFLDGPEISIDGAVVNGIHTPLFVARKTVGMHPYFEETGHVVDACDELLENDALRTMLTAAHSAIGFRNGITHTEVKLTRSGPVIVEINGRMGGDLIPYLGQLATGIDSGLAAADIATGRVPELTGFRRRAVGIRFGYPSRDCVVEAIALPVADDHPGLLEAAPLVRPGTTLRLPPGGYIARHGYVICAAEGPLDCTTRLDDALAAIELSGSPAAQHQPYQEQAVAPA